MLSLAEVDKAVRDVLGLDSLYSAKPVLIRAFQAAKDTSKGKKRPTRSGLSRDDYVEKDEFRLLLVYMRQYFEYFVAFNRIDVNMDQKLSLEEFRLAVQEGTLEKYGVHVKEEEIENVFGSIDGNEGGSILFDEFCHWAIQENLDLDDDDDYEPGEQVGFKSALEASGHKKVKLQKPIKPPAIPAWKRKLADQRHAAASVSASIISAAASKEQAAAEKLARLKARANREFTRAASLSRIEEHRERKRMVAAEMRKDYEQMSGRDLVALVEAVEMPTEEEITSISKTFNDALQKFDPDSRTFYSLFKAMDMDGSRRISFAELENMVRKRLGMKESLLGQSKLLSVWKKLDSDLSGFVDAGELSRFLRIGQSKELTPAQIARNKLQKARERQMEVIREESRMRLEKKVIDKAQEVEKASAEDLRRFGELFNKSMRGIHRNFYALFKSMDNDESGKAKYTEFERMVREDLKVKRADLDDTKLLSLWAAIDDNMNGFICSGEFVRFMRTASQGLEEKERLDQNYAAETNQKVREQQALQDIKKEETWARHRATQSTQKAKAMEMEAERIERLLADFESLRAESDTLRAATSRATPGKSGKKSRSKVKADFSSELAGTSEDPAPDADDDGASAVPSPGAQSSVLGSTTSPTSGMRMKRQSSSTIRAEALTMLAREVNQPAYVPRRSGSMILPTLKREEGHL